MSGRRRGGADLCTTCMRPVRWVSVVEHLSPVPGIAVSRWMPFDLDADGNFVLEGDGERRPHVCD